VPAGQLRGMATQGLLETALSYPLLVKNLLSNTPQEGIEALRGQCNALDEFLRRPDAAQVLLDLYESAAADRADRGVCDHPGGIRRDSPRAAVHS